MNNQPENCERCGAKLQIDGEPCYQKNCNYLKEAEEEESDDDYFLDDAADLIIETASSDDEDDGILSDIGEEVADGCVWSVLKFFWYVITLPFRIIFNIFAFFFDD